MLGLRVLNEDKIVLFTAYRCPRCQQMAFGDKDVLELVIAMPLNKEKTAHFCTACCLIFRTYTN